MAFTEYALLPSITGTLTRQGLTTPTEIQRLTIPPQLKRRAVVGVSETGSGKTLAFVLPILHELKVLEEDGDPVTSPGRPRGLILVPGRELGEQVCRVFKGLTHDTRLRVRSVLGGTKKQISHQNVSGPFEVLVATPGRLAQFLETKQLRLDDLRVMVLDEADRLLDPGFLPTIDRALSASPPHMRLALFAATLSQAFEPMVAELFGEKPEWFRTSGSRRAAPTLETKNVAFGKDKRFDALRTVLAEAPSTSTLLFVNTREQGEALAKWLGSEGLSFRTYMGEMDSSERRRNLKAFRTGAATLLVSTDLAARGLDIDGVDRVINVHLPRKLDDYKHRIGRTARAGRAGVVVNLYEQPREQPVLEKLQLP